MTSPITDPGMISPIILLSLKPKVFDHAPNKPYVTLKEIQERYSKKVKACIINHYSGIPSPEIELISRWLKKKNVYLIEDCSQSHGAVVNKRKVGDFGDLACFSTMFSKGHSTGGTGGVLYTNFLKLFKKSALYLDRGKPIYSKKFSQKNPKTFLVPALNLRSNEILSAIGLLTLEKVPEVNKKRIDFLRTFNQKLILKKLPLSLYPYNGSEAPYFAIIQLDKKWSLSKKLRFGQLLQKKGIQINSHYEYVATEWPWLKDFLTDSFNPINALNYRNQSMNLLFNENFTNQHAEAIANLLSLSLHEMKRHS